MTNNFPFTGLGESRFFVGYEPILKKMEEFHNTVSKAVPNYPPYNIVKVEDNKYVIEMAVAGFGKHNIDIEIQDGTLLVSGHTDVGDMVKEGLENTYLYKGISDRNFKRSFNIADTIEIKNAELFNGMLKIWLERIIPESKKPKKIEIVDPQSDKPSSEKQFLQEGTK
jgi:molecular chaperone IbpA